MNTAANTLHEQFDTSRQQLKASKLGMWTFLATEVLLFGVLFCVYAYYRFAFPQGFALGSKSTDVVLGTIETAVLLTSSLAMALSIRAIRLAQRRAAVWLLIVTAALGLSFLGMHAGEYVARVARASFSRSPLRRIIALRQWNRNVLYALLRHDRPACAARRRRRVRIARARDSRVAGCVFSDVFHAARTRRVVLASRRRGLDIPVPVVLSGVADMSTPSVRTLRQYLGVWVALMVLVALTVASAYVRLGAFNLVASLAISAAKTALVMALYMELRRERGTILLFAITGFCWLGLMIVPIVADIAMR